MSTRKDVKGDIKQTFYRLLKSFEIYIFRLFPFAASAKEQTQYGSEQQGPGGEETFNHWKKKRRPYESIVTIICATQVGSLEKIKEEKLKQMLEYNITLMNLQRESDKYLAKIQSNKVGKKHLINLRNCSLSLSRDNNPTWRRGEKRKGLQFKSVDITTFMIFFQDRNFQN